MLDEQTRQFFERAAQAVTLYLMERTAAVVVTGGETFALH
jgi:hypothetical protein